MKRAWKWYKKGMKRVRKGHEKGIKRVWQGYKKGMNRVCKEYMEQIWRVIRVWDRSKGIHSVCQTETVANALHTSISQGLRVSLLVDKAVAVLSVQTTHLSVSVVWQTERFVARMAHGLHTLHYQPGPGLKESIFSRHITSWTVSANLAISTCDNPWRWDWIQANSNMILSA